MYAVQQFLFQALIYRSVPSDQGFSLECLADYGDLEMCLCLSMSALQSWMTSVLVRLVHEGEVMQRSEGNGEFACDCRGNRGLRGRACWILTCSADAGIMLDTFIQRVHFLLTHIILRFCGCGWFHSLNLYYSTELSQLHLMFLLEIDKLIIIVNSLTKALGAEYSLTESSVYLCYH